MTFNGTILHKVTQIFTMWQKWKKVIDEWSSGDASKDVEQNMLSFDFCCIQPGS